MLPPHSSNAIAGSFRDPSGVVFQRDGLIYRQINLVYREHYDLLIESGLYRHLVDAELLIPHEEVRVTSAQFERAYKTIQPELIPFISYPYEWSFSQLKDAALLTLEIQKISLNYGMSLKDCSAYNIQFWKGKPILIDTLSFERYSEGRPWVAYRQFCQHFLAPLALMAHRDVRLNQLFRIHIDGIPLDLASELLPFRTRLTFSLLSHIHLHAKSQSHFADKSVNMRHSRISRHSFLGLIDNLECAVKRLTWQPKGTEWGDYYEDTNYSTAALQHKTNLVAAYLERVKPKIVWDLGANIGLFSQIASDRGVFCVSFDIDPAAVEKNYVECRKRHDTNILPLLLDLTNPSPNIGWDNRERFSLPERGPADTILALALIHHLAISNNVPIDRIASFLASLCSSLIIEFVPKQDSQVKRLLLTREDIFPDYSREAFEREFSEHFTVQDVEGIRDSERILYLMKKK